MHEIKGTSALDYYRGRKAGEDAPTWPDDLDNGQDHREQDAPKEPPKGLGNVAVASERE